MLLINDLKFISAGRIEKECIGIDEEILKSIQNQVLQVCFPKIYTDFLNQQTTIMKYEKQITDQAELIQKLKSENNTHRQKLSNIEKKYNEIVNNKKTT